MPFDIDTEPVIIKVPSSVALPPGNVSPSEWTAYKGRVATLETQHLGDIANVDETDISDGDALLYDEATGTYKPGTPGEPLVVTDDGVIITPDTNQLYVWSGIRATVSAGASRRANLSIEWGGTGSAQTAARSDHAHTLHSDRPFPFPATGTLSGGTRQLVAGNVTGLNPDLTYVLDGDLRLDLQGEGTGGSYTMLRIIIANDTESRFGESRTVAGVPREASMRHHGQVVFGVSSVAVRAEIQFMGVSDPIHIGAGELMIGIKPDR